MSRPRYLIVLTWVRVVTGDAVRDERVCPERIVEAVGAADVEGAQCVFRAMCALPAVRCGRQRAKVIDLAGQSVWEVGDWVAPLVTDASRAALRRMGVRRGRSWS